MTKEKNILKTLSEVLNYFKTGKRQGNSNFTFSEEKLNSANNVEIINASKFLGISKIQTLFFATILQLSNNHRVDMDDIAACLNMNYIEFLSYREEIDELAKKGLVFIRNNDSVRIPNEVIEALIKGKKYKKPSINGLNTAKILKHISNIAENLYNNETDGQQFVDYVDSVIKANPETSISKAIHKFGIDKVTRDERSVFYILLYKYHFEQDDCIRWGEIEEYLGEDFIFRAKNHYYSEIMSLQKKEIIVYSLSNGLVNKDEMKIADSALDQVLADVGGTRRRHVKVHNMIDYKSIEKRDLFYDSAVEKQVATLESMMHEARYVKVRKSLKEKKLRTGFTCLFYGAPGTGKTETVYQLAKKTGRKIIVADVSKLKNCYVGESEKNVKALFDNYREIVKQSEKVPILLFNEADAIFGVRMERADKAVDKMENSIQNIILQEMEDLDGILIATTNLTTNLDKAFERRFLYKIRFEKPSVEIKSKIWKSFLPELNSEQSNQLAKLFDFSGGQIENISRKMMIDSIIKGEEPSFDDIKEYCYGENIETAEGTRIGF